MILLISKKNKKISYQVKKYYNKYDDTYYYYRVKCYDGSDKRGSKSYTADLLNQWTLERLENYWYVVDTDSDNIELLEALYGDLRRFRREGGASPTEKA